jgi:hypothetical protein
LSLQIGRLSVLRHSVEMGELEQKKLAQSDPLFGYHMLGAYIAAEKRDRPVALQELQAALAASSPGDDAYTSAAEVYAILADNPRVIEALGRAAARKEPTAAYILANPLFRYLTSDPQFEKITQSLTAEQAEIRTALQHVP